MSLLGSGYNINKIKAYKKVAKSYYDAVRILYERKLAFGEPAIVPFYHPDETDPDKKVKLAIGFGSINGGVEVLPTTLMDSSTRIDDSEVGIVIDGETHIFRVADAFEYILEQINDIANGSISDDDIRNIVNS